MICRREQAASAASAVAAGLPPVDPEPTTAPNVADALPASAPATRGPDSAPATVTDPPEAQRRAIRIPSYVFLILPAAVLLGYSLFARQTEPVPDARDNPSTASVEAAADINEPTSSADEESNAVASPAIEEPTDRLATAAKIVELEQSRDQAARLESARESVKVTLYSTERCTRCLEARRYLLAHGIRPVERDIDKDARARARLRALNARGGLPTIEVDGKVLVGFDAARLERSIDRAATARLQRKR